MQLTRHTDYSLRVLIYLGLHDERRVTVTEVASTFGISRNHLLKVVHRLSVLGYVHARRGRGGGLALARRSDAIRVGEVVRAMEGSLEVIDCSAPSACPILPACVLKDAVNNARDAFLAELDAYTIEDLLGRRRQLLQLLSA